MKFLWNSNIFIHENALENVVGEMASILSRPHCVKFIVLMDQALHKQLLINRQLIPGRKAGGCGFHYFKLLNMIPCFQITERLYRSSYDKARFNHDFSLNIDAEVGAIVVSNVTPQWLKSMYHFCYCDITLKFTKLSKCCRLRCS